MLPAAKVRDQFDPVPPPAYDPAASRTLRFTPMSYTIGIDVGGT